MTLFAAAWFALTVGAACAYLLACRALDRADDLDTRDRHTAALDALDRATSRTRTR